MAADAGPPVVREFQPADAEAFAEVTRAAVPYLFTTGDVVAWQVAHAPAAQRLRLFVAESDGRVVGVARTGMVIDSAEPGRATANVHVLPEARGGGVGSALLAAAEAYLAGVGAVAVHGLVLDEPASVRFAERRGYRRGRPSTVQRLDLANRILPPLQVPDGVEVRTGADFADDPHPLYLLDVEAARDEPQAVPTDTMPYQDWLPLYWDRPDTDRALTSVVVVDNIAAAFSLAQTDGRARYWSGMTGSLRAYRGRGLAKLAKNFSLHRARDADYTEAFTTNDDVNGPMLAINRWLGYEPSTAICDYRRDLR